MKPPGSGLATPRSQTRSPSPGMASKGGAGSSSKLDAASKSKARSSSVPAGQKGIPTPKSSGGGAGKPPIAAGGGGGGGDKAGSRYPLQTMERAPC